MLDSMIGEGLKPTGVNLNVLNILRCLMEDNDSVMYIPQDYKSGSVTKSYDSKVHVAPSESGKPIEVISLGSHQERFNFSVLGLMSVMVEQENNDGTVELVPKKVYRQYNVIRDGKLTMDHIVAKLSEESFTCLRDAGILYYNGMKVPSNHNHQKDFIYKIRLSDIPLVSCNWARPVALGLYKSIIEDKELSVQISAIKSLIKKYRDNGMPNPPKYDDSVYTEKGDAESTKGTKEEQVDCVVYDVKTNNNVSPDDLIESYSASFEDIGTASKYLKELNKSQKNVRLNIRCIVMAIENSKKKGNFDWSEMEKVPRSKNKVRQSCIVEDTSGCYQLTRTKWKQTVLVPVDE